MNKKEFLNELESKLVGLPKEDISDRIDFYSEMIDEKVHEGKSEEEVIKELGSTDDIVKEIAYEIPLTKLVKQKVKPKRQLKAWEIVLIILGFPLWLPLVLVAFILCLVAYLLIWVLVIVTYVVELALVVGSIGSLVAFFLSGANAVYLGLALMYAGAAILLVFGCIGATKLTLKLSKKIITKIKTSFMKKGNN